MELVRYPWSSDVNVQICDFSQSMLQWPRPWFFKTVGRLFVAPASDCSRVTGAYSTRFASLRTRLISGLVLNSAWKLCGEIRTVVNDCLDVHAGEACVFQKNNERRLIFA